MGTKELVLRMLECQRDRHVSGAWLAEELGVTRNAVWKAVEVLRAEGYVVEAATNRGYRLAQENDLLSPASIERFLPDGHPFDITVRKSVDSTNAEARRRALEARPRAWSWWPRNRRPDGGGWARRSTPPPARACT